MKNYNYRIYIENFYDRKEKVLSYGHNMSFFTMIKEFFDYIKKLNFDKEQIERFTFDNLVEYNTINENGDALYLEITL